MKQKILIAIMILACFAPSFAMAKKRVTLGDVNGTGVDDRQIETLRNLIYSEIVAHPKAEYVDDNYDIEIVADLTRLQQSYILTLYGYDADNNSTSEKAKLYDFDEIDVAAKRLVAALIENKALINTAERGEVLEEEQEEPTRVRSIQGWELALGGAYPLTDALGAQDSMYAFAGSYFFDIQPFFIELRADFQLGFNDSSKNFSSFTIGGNYFYYNGRMMGAYTGIELGIGGATNDNLDESIGFVAAFDVGVMLLRQADVNLDLRLRTSVLATDFYGKTPVTSALMIGIVF